MAQLIADRRDVDFVLHEQLDVGSLSENERYAEFNKKTVDLIISEARNLAVKEILPTQKEGDAEGCTFDGGAVSVPECFHRPWNLFKEGEWLAMNEDPEWGGQGMPKTVGMAAAEFLNGANYAFMMYPGLTHGAGKLVEAFGTEKLKKLFLRKCSPGSGPAPCCLPSRKPDRTSGPWRPRPSRTMTARIPLRATKFSSLPANTT